MDKFIEELQPKLERLVPRTRGVERNAVINRCLWKITKQMERGGWAPSDDATLRIWLRQCEIDERRRNQDRIGRVKVERFDAEDGETGGQRDSDVGERLGRSIAAMVHEWLNALPSRLRDAIWFVVCLGVPPERAAVALRVHASTVRRQVRLGIKMLRAQHGGEAAELGYFAR